MKKALSFLLPVSIALCLTLYAYASLTVQFLKPVFVAHRGTISPLRPDNTLGAIKFAIISGIRNLEVDASISHDGHIFLFHDKHINEENTVAPSPFMGREISDLDSAEVRQIRLKPQAQKISSLEEVLNLLKEFPAILQIDMKRESIVMVAGLVESFARAGQPGNLIIQFKSLTLLQHTKEKYPEVQTLLRVKDPTQLQYALASKADIIELEEWDSLEAVDRIHAHQKQVLVNVSASSRDHCASWRALWIQGVDRILTNDALNAQNHCSSPAVSAFF